MTTMKTTQTPTPGASAGAGRKRGRPRHVGEERREGHLVRVRRGTWAAMVEVAGGRRKVGAMLDESFGEVTGAGREGEPSAGAD